MAQPHWTDSVIQLATADINRAKAAMAGTLLRPVLRRPNVADQVAAALSAPPAQPYPADARQRLLSMLTSRYGEQAQNVAPYLGIAEEDTNG